MKGILCRLGFSAQLCLQWIFGKKMFLISHLPLKNSQLVYEIYPQVERLQDLNCLTA
jgi:hypothetical protein